MSQLPVFAYGERLLKCWTEQSSSDFGMGTRAVKLPSEYLASRWCEAYMGCAGTKTDPFQNL